MPSIPSTWIPLELEPTGARKVGGAEFQITRFPLARVAFLVRTSSFSFPMQLFLICASTKRTQGNRDLVFLLLSPVLCLSTSSHQGKRKISNYHAWPNVCWNINRHRHDNCLVFHNQMTQVFQVQNLVCHCWWKHWIVHDDISNVCETLTSKCTKEQKHFAKHQERDVQDTGDISRKKFQFDLPRLPKHTQEWELKLPWSAGGAKFFWPKRPTLLRAIRTNMTADADAVVADAPPAPPAPRWSLVFCLLPLVLGPWSLVFGLQSLVFCLWSFVFCLRSFVFCPCSLVLGPWSLALGPWSLVFCLLPLVFCLLSLVFCLLSLVFCLWSLVLGPWSLVFGLWSLVLCFWSLVFCLSPWKC